MKSIMTIPLICVAVFPLTAQDVKAPGDVVTLAFDWPVGLTAQVTATRIQMAGHGATVDTTARMTYTMTVSGHPAGRLIRYDGFTAPEIVGTPTLESISEQFGGVVPAMVVGGAGDLLEIKELDRLQAFVQQMLQPMLDSLPQRSAAMDRLFRQLTSEQFLFAKAAEEWNSLVGMWIESELEIGALYEMQLEEPSPVDPQILIPMQYQFVASKRTACSSGASHPGCVLLEMVSHPDPDAMRELISSMFGEFGNRGANQLVYEELAIENHVRLVAEPGTLIPYDLEVTQLVEGSGREGGGELTAFRNYRSRRYRYDYGN